MGLVQLCEFTKDQWWLKYEDDRTLESWGHCMADVIPVHYTKAPQQSWCTMDTSPPQIQCIPTREASHAIISLLLQAPWPKQKATRRGDLLQSISAAVRALWNTVPSSNLCSFLYENMAQIFIGFKRYSKLLQHKKLVFSYSLHLSFGNWEMISERKLPGRL